MNQKAAGTMTQILLYISALTAQAESIDEAVAYRDALEYVSIDLRIESGALDWPEEERSTRRLHIWFDAARDRQRVDLLTDGAPREVYCYQCEFPQKYFEYFEFNPGGTITAKFTDGGEGSVATSHIFDPRSIALPLCSLFALPKNVGDSFQRLNNVASIPVSGELLQRISETRDQDGPKGLTAIQFKPASNSTQTVVIDKFRGPSVVYSKLVVQLPDDGGICSQEMSVSLREWSPKIWYPDSLRFTSSVDNRLLEEQRVSVTDFSTATIPEKTFLLSGMDIKDGTLIHGAGSDWTIWDASSGSLQPDNSEYVTDTTPNPSPKTKWLIGINVIGALGLVILLWIRRKPKTNKSDQ